jgi:hypothetical protein
MIVYVASEISRFAKNAACFWDHLTTLVLNEGNDKQYNDHKL